MSLQLAQQSLRTIRASGQLWTDCALGQPHPGAVPRGTRNYPPGPLLPHWAASPDSKCHLTLKLTEGSSHKRCPMNDCSVLRNGVAQVIELYEREFQVGEKKKSLFPLRTQWHFRSPSPWHRFQSDWWQESQHRDDRAGQGTALFDSLFWNVLAARCELVFVLFCSVMCFCPPHHSETFSFVLTGEDGSRRFGYCRRLLVSMFASQSARALCRASAGVLGFTRRPERARGHWGVAGSLRSLKMWRSEDSQLTWVLLADGNNASVFFGKKILSPVFSSPNKRSFSS